MTFLREGDRGKALAKGRGWVPITYMYRSVRLKKTGIDVPNVLVGVDDDTGETLVIPSQSTPRLKAARQAVKDDVVQVKIPHELDDMLVVIADRLEAPPKKFTPALLRYYLSEAAESSKLAGRLVRLSKGSLAKGPTGCKLSFRSSPRFKARVTSASGANISVLTRGAIVAAKEDVLDGKSKLRSDKLKAVAKAI